MYGTRSIAGILEPVSQQVSKLIVLHEEGEESGIAMDSLEAPVHHVKMAVDNLAKVARDTSNSSEDSRLKTELPNALTSIQQATSQLVTASSFLSSDPKSQRGRDNLIEGSRGILQGTTAMLMAFDEAQVRKLVRICKKVLDYLAVAEILDTMEDLATFVKDLSPALGKMCTESEERRQDLVDHDDAEALKQHLEQIKTLAPVLICAVKIAIQVINNENTNGAKSNVEAMENRSYLIKRMTDEVQGIIKVLNHKPNIKTNTMVVPTINVSSEDKAKKAAKLGVNVLGDHNIDFSTDFFNDYGTLRSSNMGPSLDELKSSLEQQLRMNSSKYRQTLKELTELATRIADNFDGHVKMDVLDLATRLENSQQDKPELLNLLNQLQQRVDEALEQRLMSDLSDLYGPLENFLRSINENQSVSNFNLNVDEKGQQLKLFAQRLCRTALVVAMSKRNAQDLRQLATRVQTLTPQLINASAIALNYPENNTATENLANLSTQYRADLHKIRALCEQVMGSKKIILATEKALRERVLVQCEEHLRFRQEEKARKECTKAHNMAKNVILDNLRREIEENDDPSFKYRAKEALSKLQVALDQFDSNSDAITNRPGDNGLMSAWKSCANKLIEAVNESNRVIIGDHPAPPPIFGTNKRTMKNGVPNNVGSTPPRPPLPAEVRRPMAPKIIVDEAEADAMFGRTSAMDRPIHKAASGLYEEVRQWDHTDNEIIAAAKKIAFLMAHLAELVRPGRGTKRELIACAKGLAEVSERITELAKELARHCTDKKIRTNLLQVCEKIPTIGTQLKVLATVKATMLGSNLSEEEDSEAMDMLIFNADKLNEAVKETVQAAESASIRVRTDAGFRLKWERKQPWFREADYY